MERKRKLPARAAARVEQAAKRRTSTPPADGNTTRSATPALSAAGGDDTTAENGQSTPALGSQLPRSIQAGKPLPTVEQAQADDLPAADYQSFHESGVLAESLSRSRQKWISEGIFERYWAKPSKRRGVAVDDPKNPPKDSMVKLGQIIVTVEPHVFEATMFGVKDPKPTPSLPPNVRPIIMYGPSRGSMPPPTSTATPPPTTPRKLSQSHSQTPKMAAAAPPGAVPSTPLQKPSIPASTPTSVGPPASTPQQPPQQLPRQTTPQAIPQTNTPQPAGSSVLQPPMMQQPTPLTSGLPSIQPSIKQEPPRAVPPVVAPPRPTPSPRGMESILSPTSAAGQPLPPVRSLVQQSPPVNPSLIRGPSPSGKAPQAGFAGRPAIVPAGAPPVASPVVGGHHPAPAGIAAPGAPPRPNPSPSPSAGTPRQASAHPPGTDSIIVTLAERATEDPHLRDLMKRVANGNAPKEELDRFQAIIDQITAETKRNGAAQGPSADRLLVDGRTVRFFAEEVRIILDIVLRTNPKQTSVDLRPPAGSDPLVVLLVKTALDDARVREMVRRIGENRPQFSDATDLKAVLDRLKGQVAREQERARQKLQAGGGPAAIAPAGGVAALPGGGTNAATLTPAPATTAATSKANGLSNGAVNHANHAGHGGGSAPVQALRSKGPPPAPKVDVSAVVFEFAGGTGDRYMFPKFSILEYKTTPQGHQEVVASFLIVRKGSKSEYGGDPDLDYYQPVTIRLQVALPPPGSGGQLSTSQKQLLDYLGRVVAPADEVKRYMDNIMNNMTRAEYVLLAMRLPKRDMAVPLGAEGADGEDSKMLLDADKADKTSESKTNGLHTVGQPQPMEGVLWTTTTSSSSTPQQKAVKRIVDEDQQYQNFISTLTPREVEDA